VRLKELAAKIEAQPGGQEELDLISEYFDLDNHLQLWWHQSEVYRDMRDNSPSGTLVVVQDFVTFDVQEEPNLADLVMVLKFVDEQGKHMVMNIDIFDEGTQRVSKDWLFVKAAWEELASLGLFDSFTRVVIWSDTGPNHFKTSNTLYFFRKLQEAVPRCQIVISFFAPYHGHSPCDGHGGNGKSHIAAAARNLNESNQKWDRKWVKERIGEMPSTDTTINIKRVEMEKQARTLKGIKQYFVLTFPINEPNAVDCAVCYDAPSTTRLYFTPK